MATETRTGLQYLPPGALQPDLVVNAILDWLSSSQVGAVTVEFTVDANLTLTSAQYLASALVFTDSPATLTTGRDVVFPAYFPLMVVRNNTAQTLTLKKSGQTGVTVTAASSIVIAAGPTDVVAVAGSSGGVTDGDKGDVTVSGSGATWTLDPDVVRTIRTVPQNSQSAAYTLVLDDAGKHILHPSADTTARIFTIPANASVAYPVGTAVTFVNQNAAGTITIAITSDTMRLAGAGTTGSRTLAANGIATAIKITSTEWIISGTGLT